ncbi:MAG: COX15/CtaA family protein [Gemmatimonadota bacterium]|nr:COX15/CtaA family protein [Gemmatimonadota bacterium]
MSASTTPLDSTVRFHEMPPERRRSVARWLTVWAAMLVLIVVIGGVTRLTESGLSITEWAPVAGTLPPLSASAWDAAFEAYQQIPEYQQLNRGMTLAEFKQIYFWEYLHRLWARLVGLAFAVPFVVFLARGGLPRRLVWRLATLLLLTAGQGALGWFMVASGLAERTDVSQYRLAAHLGLALVIYVATVWTVADLRGGTAERRNGGTSIRQTEKLLTYAGMLVGLVFLTAIAGAFVAGLDGGRAYNTFPLMGGRVVPGGYGTLSPWWRNLFENVAAVQFNHRLLGILSVLGALGTWAYGRRLGLAARAQLMLMLLPLVALAQATFGIVTLLLVVPVGFAALHQTGAVLLLTVSVLLYHELRLERGRGLAPPPAPVTA